MLMRGNIRVGVTGRWGGQNWGGGGLRFLTSKDRPSYHKSPKQFELKGSKSN